MNKFWETQFYRDEKKSSRFFFKFKFRNSKLELNEKAVLKEIQIKIVYRLLN